MGQEHTGPPEKRASNSHVRVIGGAAKITREAWNGRRPAGSRIRSEKSSKKKRRTTRRSTAPAFESLRKRIKRPTSDTIKLALRLLLPIFLCGVGVTVGAKLLRDANQPHKRTSAGAVPVIQEETFDAGTAEDWKGMVPNEVASHFLNATSHDERLKWIRNPEAESANLLNFYSNEPGSLEKVGDVRPMNSRMAGKVTFDRFLVTLESGRTRFLNVVIEPEGARVDFPSFAEWSSAPWSEIVSGKVEEVKEARLSIMGGNFYQAPFGNDREWMHFSASSPGQEDSIDIYAAVGSQKCRILRSLLGPEPVRVTVSLRKAPTSGPKPAFEVTEFLSADWVVGDSSVRN